MEHQYNNQIFNIEEILTKKAWDRKLIEHDALADYNQKELIKKGWQEKGIGFYFHQDYPEFWFDCNSLIMTLYKGKKELEMFDNVENALIFIHTYINLKEGSKVKIIEGEQTYNGQKNIIAIVTKINTYEIKIDTENGIDECRYKDIQII